jgi:hypothetical protein
MKEIVKRLGEDMRWRLSAAGKAFAPKPKERDSWGGKRVSGALSCLSWLALSVLTFGVVNGIMLSGADAGALVGIARIMVAAPAVVIINLILLPVVFVGGRALEKRWDLAQYRSLLSANERFMLSEYARYLERQARRTQLGELRGGSSEAVKLAAAAAQVREILAAKVPAEQKHSLPLGTDEALAQSVVEAYGLLTNDPLRELDARLTEQQRLKVADLERSLDLEQGQHSGGQLN